MTEEELLDRAIEVAGYAFKDPDLLVAALTHASLADHRLAVVGLPAPGDPSELRTKGQPHHILFERVEIEIARTVGVA